MTTEYWEYPAGNYIHAGYTCTCGAWVNFGAPHTCPTIFASTDERIANALERIALTLEYMQQMQAGTTQTPED